MRTTRKEASRAAIALACVVAVALAAPGASAGDLESLRARAQLVADQVSQREHDLERLESKQASLADEITDASSELGILELDLHRAEVAHQRALENYVDRAVEAYMDGSATELALLLSAKDMNQLFTLTEATVASAAEDVEAVQAAVELQEAAERRQLEIDERKQRLLAAQSRVEAVEASIRNALAARTDLLARLTADVEELEQQARKAAAAAAEPDEAFLKLLGGAGPAPAIPDGYVGTGVTFEGLASWYGPGFEGNHTASGDVFDSSLYTAASKELPLGTWLFIQHGGRGVVVLVNDRGPYVGDRILDLSRAAADAIGLTSAGVGWVEAQILIER